MKRASLWAAFTAFFTAGCGINKSFQNGQNYLFSSFGLTQSEETFYLKNGALHDLTGKEFVMRGVNMPFAYYYQRSLDSLEKVKANKFNSVRIVWCADTLIRGGRCDPKDIHPLSYLEEVLAKLRSLKLVAVLNLQNATGSNDPNDLIKLVDWYLKPEVLEILNRYKDMTIINIANEWYGSWDDYNNVYLNTYINEISRLRNAGLKHTLIVDARGWGQQFSSIIEKGPDLVQSDSNLLLSAHMYDVFSTAKIVEESFAAARSKGIPLVIGEFACTHYPGQYVPCDTIMKEAELGEPKVGTLAWSFSGNGSPLEILDLFDRNDWSTLTAYGQRIVFEDSNSVSKTSKEACLFGGQNC